jgi:hypothetical protein
MDALYGEGGRVNGWLRDDEFFLDLNGRYLAFLVDDGVFAYRSGQHVGWWEGGVMRGSDGGVVVFVRDARHLGVVRPSIAAIPARPAVQSRPARPARSARLARAARTPSWSSSTFGSW